MSTFELPIIVDDQEALDKLRADGKLAWAGDDPSLLEDEPEALAARPETELHTTADSFLEKATVAVNFAFASARHSVDAAALEAAIAIPNRATRRRAILLAMRPAPEALGAALERVLRPTLERCYASGGVTGLAMLKRQLRTLSEDEPHTLRRATSPFDMKFNAKSENAIKWAKKHTGELISDITKTTRRQIMRAVVRALDGGSPRQLYKDVLKAVGDPARADLIARSELMDAASSGQREAWAQAVEEGLLTGTEMREWIKTADEGTCDLCDNLDGKLAELDGDYPDGGGIGPPAHPRCRCTEGISPRRING